MAQNLLLQVVSKDVADERLRYDLVAPDRWHRLLLRMCLLKTTIRVGCTLAKVVMAQNSILTKVIKDVDFVVTFSFTL